MPTAPRLSRRTWASILAVVLVVGLSVVAARKSVPYVTFSPGPTANETPRSDRENGTVPADW